MRRFTQQLLGGLILGALLLPVQVFAQVYDLEVIAQTGVAVGTGTPIALGQEPSINDAGKVSFIARDIDATHGRVMMLNNGAVEKDCFIGTIASVEDEVQVIFKTYFL